MVEDDGRTIERHLRAAVESAPSGLLMVDQDGRIVLVNREIERLFGFDRAELVGASIDLLVLSSIVDISARQREEAERKELEAQLRQAQKLEAVGTLAAGIAHDFNNILGAILGFADLLADQVEGPQGRADLKEIKQFVQRGKTLVDRIQAFSRRQDAKRVPVSLEGVVDEVASLLRSSVGPGIEIRSRVAPEVR